MFFQPCLFFLPIPIWSSCTLAPESTCGLFLYGEADSFLLKKAPIQTASETCLHLHPQTKDPTGSGMRGGDKRTHRHLRTSSSSIHNSGSLGLKPSLTLHVLVICGLVKSKLSVTVSTVLGDGVGDSKWPQPAGWSREWPFHHRGLSSVLCSVGF